MIRLCLALCAFALAGCSPPPDLPPPAPVPPGPAPVLVDLATLDTGAPPAQDPGAAVLARADALRR
jgi:hypothetical protein